MRIEVRTLLRGWSPCTSLREHLVFQSLFRSGRIHTLVNNAGVSHIGKLEATSERDFDRVFQLNVKGFYHCMLTAVEHMKTNGGGVILNMASIGGSSGLAERFAYSMSKGAVIAVTYSVAKDYLACNIRCNCILPTWAKETVQVGL